MLSGFKRIFRETVMRIMMALRSDKLIKKYGNAEKFISHWSNLARLVKESFYILLGIISAGFGLKGFLLPNSFIDGGVTGISLLTAQLTDLPLSVLILIINLPFIALGYKQINKSFAKKSIIAIAGLALAVAFIEYPVITSDKLLVAMFGGFFLGAEIGLSIRGGGVLDGTEILAIYISKKSSYSIGDVILVFNIMIFSVAAYLLYIEIALYAMLTYIAASKTVDFLVEGIEEYMGVSIVSEKSEEIRLMITGKLERGVTIINGNRGIGKIRNGLGKVDILYTVITRLEVSKLQSEIDQIDSKAFVVISCIKDVKGGMIKKHHTA
jgi:uncharacterized membrane-anchored protein YitT (DUF2179 family)